MFSHQEILQFRAFGFVVLRGLFTAAEIAKLRAEVTTELRAAFGGIGTDPDEGGIPGDYLPLAVDRTPFSQSLIADDPRLFQGAAELCGATMVPTPGEAVCFTGHATPWHNDQGPDVGGVKFLVHLDARTAETGALRVIPGSHDPAFARRLASYWASDPGRQGFEPWPVPDVVLATQPGDVIAFDLHLYHASTSGGRKRLAWTIEYLPWPGLGDPEKLLVVRDLIAEEPPDGYDRDRWPEWREWVAGAASPSRNLAIDRLRLLGVLPPEPFESGEDTSAAAVDQGAEADAGNAASGCDKVGKGSAVERGAEVDEGRAADGSGTTSAGEVDAGGNTADGSGTTSAGEVDAGGNTADGSGTSSAGEVDAKDAGGNTADAAGGEDK